MGCRRNTGEVDVLQKRSTLGRRQFLIKVNCAYRHGSHSATTKTCGVFVVWHGMPLKAMGYAENRDVALPFNFDDENYLIATSTIMRNALAACFNQDARRIFVTGSQVDKLLRAVKRILEILKIDPARYNKIILFAPTFRSADYREDGQLISYNLIS